MLVVLGSNKPIEGANLMESPEDLAQLWIVTVILESSAGLVWKSQSSLIEDPCSMFPEGLRTFNVFDILEFSVPATIWTLFETSNDVKVFETCAPVKQWICVSSLSTSKTLCQSTCQTPAACGYSTFASRARCPCARFQQKPSAGSKGEKPKLSDCEPGR